jgi:hypothetical protein
MADLCARFPAGCPDECALLGCRVAAQERGRAARAATYRADEARRRAICAGLDLDACAAALAAAGEITPTTAAAIRRPA